MSNNIGIIIQARTSSTRLPKKIIKKFDGDYTFLDVLLSRLALLANKIPIVLATTTNTDDLILGEYAAKYNLPVFFGSENNVLERFLDCAKKFKFDVVIRVCSDNPFLDINLILELIENYKVEDYLSYMIEGKPSILTHSGFFSELVSVKALNVVKKTGNLTCVEHVTNCVYNNPETFNIRFINKKVPNAIRCTLDTAIDFENLKSIYFDWYKNRADKDFNYNELVEFIVSRNDLLKEMQKEIINNIK